MSRRAAARVLLTGALALVLSGQSVHPAAARGLVFLPIDADSVDGFDASLAPTPGWLLPLDGTGRYPLQTIPQGPGSGLNADMVDGKHLSEILASPAGGLDCLGCVGTTDLADVAVTGAKIAVGAVGSSQIADGSVGLGELAFDPATQAELDALAGSLSSTGVVNNPANPVDWRRLKSVPAGFADGVDDVGGGVASDLVCAGCVETADIGDAEVTSAKILDGQVSGNDLLDGGVGIVDLGFDPATQFELDNHKPSADHDIRYYTKSELQLAGTLNDTGNPVHWTKLRFVPGDFADGVDNVDGGVAGGLVCGGCVDGSDLAFDPATQAELDALGVAGTINTAGNPVDWTKLKGVPAGFSDGVDNSSNVTAGNGISVSGSIVSLSGVGCVNGEVWKFDGILFQCVPDNDTTYTAGAGLQLAANSFSVATGGVTSSMIADGTITGADIGTGAIGSTHIATGAVTSADIADATIVSADIADGTVTDHDLSTSYTAVVTSLADVPVREHFLNTVPAGVTQMRVTVSANGNGEGASGTVTVVRNGVNVATFAMPGLGIRPSTFISAPVAIAAGNTIDILARSSSGAPMYVRTVDIEYF